VANADFEGRVYPANAPYSVGREKIREFASAVGATHPAHHDLVAARGSGYPDLVAPPTFAVVVAQRAESQYIGDPAAQIDFSRVVHADERFTHHRPIVAGDELTTVLHVDRIVSRGAISMVTTRCEIFVLPAGAETPAPEADAPGEPVATVTSTLAIRGEDA
jgi:acyl dehydratase